MDGRFEIGECCFVDDEGSVPHRLSLAVYCEALLSQRFHEQG